MSQQKNNDQPVVRAVLEEVLNKILDEKFSDFPTSYELDQKLEKLKRDIDENARMYRDQIMDKYSPIVGDIATLRDENEIGAHQIHELRETTEDHEKRLLILEQKSLSA